MKLLSTMPLQKATMLLFLMALTMAVRTCALCQTEDIGPTQTATLEGGLKVEYILEGTGNDAGTRPIVVFLTGHGSEMDNAWAKIFPNVTEISTVLAYDRLNYGKSDASPEGVPQTGAEIVRLLRDLLQELALAPPYVVVGHSIGGLYSILFAKQYADEVAGVVLIDSSHPDQVERYDELTEQNNIFRRSLNRVYSQVLSSVQICYNEELYSEIEYWDDTAQQIQEAPAFPNIPLTVITAAGQVKPNLFSSVINCLTTDADANRELWLELQEDLVTLSPQGQQLLANNSGHFVQADEPELVLQAIHDIVTTIRGAS